MRRLTVKRLILSVIVAVATITQGVSAVLPSTLPPDKSVDLLSFIPDNADVLLTGDARQGIESMGCRVSGDSIFYSQSVSGLFDLSQLVVGESVEKFIRFSENFPRYGNGVMVVNEGEDLIYLLLEIVDDKRFIDGVPEIFGDEVTFSKKSGYHVAEVFADSYESDSLVVDASGELQYERCEKVISYSIVVKDKLVWIVDDKCASDAVKAIKAQLKAAKKQSVALVPWKKNLLTENHTMTLLLDTKSIWDAVQEQDAALAAFELGDFVMDERYNDLYITARYDVEGPAVKVSGSLLDRSGQVLPIPFFNTANINPAFLRYTNPDNILAASWAVPQGLDYMSLANHYASLAGGKLSDSELQVISSLVPYLKKIEGATISVAAGPLDIANIDYTSKWDIVASASLQPGVAQELYNLIIMAASLNEFQVKQFPDYAVIDVKYVHHYDYDSMVDTIPWEDAACDSVAICDEIAEDCDSVAGYDYESWDEEYSAVPVYDEFKVYLKVVGNDLVAATRDITTTGESVFDAAMFENNAAVMAGKIPLDGRLYNTLMELGQIPAELRPPFGVQSDIVISSTEVSWSFSLTDNNGRFVEELAKYILVVIMNNTNNQ